MCACVCTVPTVIAIMYMDTYMQGHSNIDLHSQVQNVFRRITSDSVLFLRTYICISTKLWDTLQVWGISNNVSTILYN